MRQRKRYKVAVALALVLAVSVSLWFVSPVKALDISFPSQPPSGTRGSTHSFTVKVSITDPDQILPIQSVNLYIYKSDDRANYEATCANLPLTATTKSYTSDETGGGAVTITATAENWAYGYGYGYAVWEPTGTPYDFGYGYGYGYGTGARQITYTVDWTSPTDWPAGNYKVEVKITANTTTFTEVSSEFTLSAPAPPPPAVGVGPPPPTVTPGCTDISDYVNNEGVFTENVTLESEDGNVNLSIEEGIVGKTARGSPLSAIYIIEMEEPPLPPADTSIIGLIYDLGPDGATFEPPVTLTFTYDPSAIPEGVSEENLVIAMWDEGADEWVTLEGCIVDPVTHTISAPVSRFTAFTVLAYTRPAAFTTSALTISPTEVGIGESVTISVLVANTGDLTGSHTVTFKLDTEEVYTEDVTLAGGARQKVTFTTAKDVAGTYTVNVNGLSRTFTVKAAPVPATFVTSTLTISPAEVGIGESVTISVLVANTGDLTGSSEVTLKINNIVVATKDVTLAGGTSRKATFSTAKDVAGTYTVDVNGLSDTFTVKAAPSKVINWWLIGGLIAGCIIIGAIIALLIRRRIA